MVFVTRLFSFSFRVGAFVELRRWTFYGKLQTWADGMEHYEISYNYINVCLSRLCILLSM